VALLKVGAAELFSLSDLGWVCVCVCVCVCVFTRVHMHAYIEFSKAAGSGDNVIELWKTS
jgi:hypothetical protein